MLLLLRVRRWLGTAPVLILTGLGLRPEASADAAGHHGRGPCDQGDASEVSLVLTGAAVLILLGLGLRPEANADAAGHHR